MRYPHTWTCTREDPDNPGSQDPDTGEWTPGGAVEVYNGPADCQDEGEVLGRGSDGRAVKRSDAVLFLEDESKVADHVAGDVGTITWEDGSTDDAEVEEIVRLDGKLRLRWL